MTYQEDVNAVSKALQGYPCPSCKREGFSGSLVLRTNSNNGRQFIGCSNWVGWGCRYTLDMALVMSIYYAGVDRSVQATSRNALFINSSDCVVAINQLTEVLRSAAQQVPQRKTRTKKGKRNVSRR